MGKILLENKKAVHVFSKFNISANVTDDRVEINNFKVSYKLNAARVIEFKASWDSIENAKDYIVTWRRIQDCLPNESSMVTDKTEINIQLKDEFQLNQLESSYLFNVRVNNNTQNINDQNKPKAKAINLPIIGK